MSLTSARSLDRPPITAPGRLSSTFGHSKEDENNSGGQRCYFPFSRKIPCLGSLQFSYYWDKIYIYILYNNIYICYFSSKCVYYCELFGMYENHSCLAEFECPTKCVRIKVFYKPKTERSYLIHHLKIHIS